MAYTQNYGTFPKKSNETKKALTFNSAKNNFLKKTKHQLSKDLLTKEKVDENHEFVRLVRNNYGTKFTHETKLSDFDKHIAKLLLDNSDNKPVLHGAVRFVNHLKINFDFKLPYTHSVLIKCGSKPIKKGQ